MPASEPDQASGTLIPCEQCGQYSAYANGVQAYLLENGSLQQAETAKAATQAAIAKAEAQ